MPIMQRCQNPTVNSGWVSNYSSSPTLSHLIHPIRWVAQTTLATYEVETETFGQFASSSPSVIVHLVPVPFPALHIPLSVQTTLLLVSELFDVFLARFQIISYFCWSQNYQIIRYQIWILEPLLQVC